MNIQRQILDKSRLLSVLYDNLSGEVKASGLHKDVWLYFEKYITFNDFSIDNLIEIYSGFITAYNKNCKQFLKNNKYPFESGAVEFSIKRVEYDVVLLLSVLFTPHRFRIMQLLKNQHNFGKALFIGLGPGLELKLTKENYTEIFAYDLSINEYLFTAFPDVNIKIEFFTGQNEMYFDTIYLIELLEHLEDPYLLLHQCFKSLKKGGRIYLTTATDLPQFDHLYNFPRDHSIFERKLKEIGLSLLYREEIQHNYLTMKLQPLNNFYIVEK